jgi:hypothetical protein
MDEAARLTGHLAIVLAGIAVMLSFALLQL